MINNQNVDMRCVCSDEYLDFSVQFYPSLESSVMIHKTLQKIPFHCQPPVLSYLSVPQLSSDSQDLKSYWFVMFLLYLELQKIQSYVNTIYKNISGEFCGFLKKQLYILHIGKAEKWPFWLGIS
jgi:hypothetical protein